MSDIPRAYRELGELIAHAEMPVPVKQRLVLIRSWLPRKRSILRAPVSSVKLTPSVQQRIHDIKDRGPEAERAGNRGDGQRQRGAGFRNTNRQARASALPLKGIDHDGHFHC